jgi:hypothetical protein
MTHAFSTKRRTAISLSTWPVVSGDVTVGVRWLVTGRLAKGSTRAGGADGGNRVLARLFVLFHAFAERTLCCRDEYWRYSSERVSLCHGGRDIDGGSFGDD